MRGIWDPTNNQLLAALPASDLQHIRKNLNLVLLRAGEWLNATGSQIGYVYFPITAIVSLLYVTKSGSASHLAVVGNEGLVGVSSFMGGESTLSSAVVQSAGHAYQLPGGIISQNFMRGGATQHLLLRYAHALLSQMAQTAVCNRHHSLDQRLCRWLLLSLDRSASNQLLMTQEWISNMLGVRREGVTEAAGKLQQAGMIEYRRGVITILNRKALESGACECYAAVKNKCGRVFPPMAAHSAISVKPRAVLPSIPRLINGDLSVAST